MNEEMKLKWNVFVENRCTSTVKDGKIVQHNVFNHYGFLGDCKAALKKCKGDREVFEEAVKRSLLYYYWCKCEWEVVISLWPPRDYGDIKVDVYSQIMMNWDRFSDYLWENRKELRGK